MAEINAAIPLSYQFGPTIGQHFESSVKLADMMDQRKERALDMEAKRQAMTQRAAMNPLQVQQAQQNLQQSAESFPVEMDTKKAALQAYLDKHKEDVQKFDSAQMALDAKIAADVVDQQSFDVWREFRKGLGLDPNQFGNVYNPDIQPHIDAIATAYKAKEPDQFGKTPTGLDLKYAKDPEYVAEQENILKSFLDNGKIDQSSFNALSGVVKTRPVSWQSQLPQFLSLKETGQKLDIAKTAQEIEAERIAKEKALREEQQAAEKAAAAKTAAAEYEQNTLSRIDSLISKIESGETRTGMTADAWAKFITSSKAATQKAYFDQIKNNLTVQKLLDIKAQGGTFGALSEKELELLTKSASNLDFAGSKQRNLDALREIRNTIMKVKARSGGKSTISDADADALLNKYRQ